MVHGRRTSKTNGMCVCRDVLLEEELVRLWSCSQYAGDAFCQLPGPSLEFAGDVFVPVTGLPGRPQDLADLELELGRDLSSSRQGI